MAITKAINIDVKTTGTKPIENLSNNLNQASKQAVDLTTNLSKTEKAQGVINGIGDAVGKLNPALGGAVKGMNGVILKMWEMVSNPVGAILAGIVVTLKFLYEAFQSSVAGGKEIKAVFAAITAVGAQVKDAIFGLGRALINTIDAAIKFIKLDFKGAAESMKKANKEATESYKQLGNAVDGTTAKIIYNLTKQQQAVDKARKLQAVVQSETNKLLVQSREILTDETASIKDKKKALEEVTKAEKASSKEKVRIAAEDLRIAKERAKALGGEEEKKAKVELRELTIALNEAETENAMTGIKLNKQRKMLNRQESSDAKALADEAKTRAKERLEATKEAQAKELEILKEKIADEKLTFAERRKLVLDDVKTSSQDRDKLIKQINAEEKKSIDAHNKAIADLNKRYDDEKLNREADTAVKKENLDYERKLLEINNLAQTELEKQTLIEKLDAEHKERLLIATKTDGEKQAAEKKLIDDKITADKKAAEQARANINNIAIESAQGLTNLLAGLGEKNKGIQKAALLANSALSIAQIIANTNVGAAKEVATKGIFGLSTSTVLYAKMGVSIASVLAATAKGLKGLGGGSAGGGGDTSGGGGGGAPQTPTPQFNVVGNSGVNQIAQTLGAQQPIQAFVVANQVTTQQSLDRNIVQNASLG